MKRQQSALHLVRDLARLAELIGAGGKPDSCRLARLLGREPRTIGRQVALLRSLGAPISYDGAGKRGFIFVRPWNFEEALIRWLRGELDQAGKAP